MVQKKGPQGARRVDNLCYRIDYYVLCIATGTNNSCQQMVRVGDTGRSDFYFSRTQ